MKPTFYLITNNPTMLTCIGNLIIFIPCVSNAGFCSLAPRAEQTKAELASKLACAVIVLFKVPLGVQLCNCSIASVLPSCVSALRVLTKMYQCGVMYTCANALVLYTCAKPAC